MKIFRKLIFFGLFFILSACGEKTVPELLVINLLDKELYNDSHIKGSVNVPFDNIEEYVKGLDKIQKIVLYCTNYMCSSSSFVYHLLKNQGFENVWIYEGGMAEWYQKGLPVDGLSTQEYLQFKLEKPEKETSEEEMTADELYNFMKKYNLL